MKPSSLSIYDLYEPNDLYLLELDGLLLVYLLMSS
jgi:hypothetical protein